MTDLSKATEQELREYEVETPQDISQLNALIALLADRNHDYGTFVYAMSIAAAAAFNYMASRLGVSGFQAGCADMDFLRRTRRISGPFMLVKGENMLYPQYDIPAEVQEALSKWRGWAAEQAEKLLKEKDKFVAPAVRAHWEQLAALPQGEGSSPAALMRDDRSYHDRNGNGAA